MATKIALGVTILFLIATCFFGYETRAKIGALGDKANELGMQLSSAQQQTAKAKADLTGAQDSLAKETADDEQTKAQLATIQGNLDSATSKATDLQAQVDKLTTQLAAAQGKGNAPPSADIYTQQDMDKANAQLKDAQAQVAELTQLKDTLTGKVLAVNQGWNFVVLSIGDRQGAVANAEMILQRGGSQIGKVRITSVEPSTSVADIIPGSLARGVRVQPGDQVIFPGS
jgi:chromosome segregation ATPase